MRKIFYSLLVLVFCYCTVTPESVRVEHQTLYKLEIDGSLTAINGKNYTRTLSYTEIVGIDSERQIIYSIFKKETGSTIVDVYYYEADSLQQMVIDNYISHFSFGPSSDKWIYTYTEKSTQSDNYLFPDYYKKIAVIDNSGNEIYSLQLDDSISSIAKLKWMDDHSFTFLCESTSGLDLIYQQNISTKDLDQIVYSDGIMDYSYDSDWSKIVIEKDSYPFSYQDSVALLDLATNLESTVRAGTKPRIISEQHDFLFSRYDSIFVSNSEGKTQLYRTTAETRSKYNLAGIDGISYLFLWNNEKITKINLNNNNEETFHIKDEISDCEGKECFQTSIYDFFIAKDGTMFFWVETVSYL